MFLPKKLPQACGGVLVLLLLGGCAQLEQRWPWDPGRSERRAALVERAAREAERTDASPAPDDPATTRPRRRRDDAQAPGEGAAPRPTALAPPDEPTDAPAATAVEPAEPAPPTPDEPDEPDEPVARAAPREHVAPAEPPEPAAPRASAATLELRGRVLSKTTGKPLATATPLVVFALPDPPDAFGEVEASSLPPVTVARADGDESPALYVTSPGRGVRFENRDELCHEFFSSSGPNAFQLGMLEPGDARTVDLAVPGLVQVYCTLHAGKQLSVLVAPSPHHALVQPDGGFALADLAPGRYRVEAWGEGLRPRTLSVDVGASERRPLLIYVDPEPVTDAE